MRIWAGIPFFAICLAAWAHDGHHAAPRMAATAKNFIASLTDEQKAIALLPFEPGPLTDKSNRAFWHYIPSDDIPARYGHPRPGLMLKDMSPHQKALAAALLSAGLSQQGFIKATTIMSLEDILRILEKDTKGRRDPEKYHFSIFGQPSESGTWAYRIEGHHVSLHFTVVKGKAVGNPTFFGSNPAEVRIGERAGLRVLAAEEDKARALLGSLTPEQKKIAILSEKAPGDILTERTRRAAIEGKPSGLEAAKMTPAQRKLLDALIHEYIDNLPAELAEQRRQRLAEAKGRLWFAWMGAEEKGKGHYYRVQAPGFLIEYDNTQNQANHIHSVWRDFEGDFGEDLLRTHYQTAPASHGHDQATLKK